jgi:hypothetical protein
MAAMAAEAQLEERPSALRQIQKQLPPAGMGAGVLEF